MFDLPKYFANGSFDPVSGYRIAYFFGCDDPQSFPVQTIWKRKNRAQSAYAIPLPFGQNFLELRSFGKPFEFAK